jgi:hypothetical protein
MTLPDLAAMLDPGGVTVADGAPFSVDDAERLGRALATIALRRGHGRLVFVLGRAAHAPTTLRDGLVRGLVLGGQDVRDVGVVPEPVWAERASASGGAGAFVGVAGTSTRLRLLLEGSLVDEARAQLAEVFAVGDFAAGEGSLEVVAAHG